MFDLTFDPKFLVLNCTAGTTPAGGVPEERSEEEQRRVRYCPLNQFAKPYSFVRLDMNCLPGH